MARTAGDRPDGNDKREQLLLQRIVRQDRQAITELYRIYYGRLFRFIFRLTRSYTSADELVNDIMLLVWQNAAAFRGESRVSTWIFGIAYRQAMRRVCRRQRSSFLIVDGDEPGSDEDTSVATSIATSIETEDWVWRGLRALPPEQMLTVILVFYVGMSYAECAEVTRCPVNTVKTRMFHARRKLREYLTDSAAVTGDGRRQHGHKNAG